MKTTINQDKITLLSKKGMKEIKKSINQLEIDKQKTLQSIRELDKTLVHDERLKRIEMLANLEIIESQIDDKKLLLSSAKLLPRKRTKLRVMIGSVVDLIDRHGRYFRFTIVDSVEADPSRGRISTMSPLGMNLIGKTVCDTVWWKSKKSINYYQLINIA